MQPATSYLHPRASATTKAWRLAAPGGDLRLEDSPVSQVRASTVLVRMEAVPLLSYLGDYVAGKLTYWYPPSPFTPGTNGVGIVQALGDDVHHLAVGQRVVVNPHLVANEITEEPAQILIGLTGVSADSGPMLQAWRDGTLREAALLPVSAVAPLEGQETLSSERLATLGKFAVPLGGLLRGRLAQGERVVVNGATGYFGSAAVLLALALGAERVVAAGRSKDMLNNLRLVGGARVVPVELSGQVEVDTVALKKAVGKPGAHVAFDQVGGAADPNSTLAALRSLRRGGRMVLMGSMTAPLPISYGDLVTNDWELLGNFMYRADAFKTLVALVRSGLLDLDKVTIRSFPMAHLALAMDCAARMRGLDCTVVLMGQD